MRPSRVATVKLTYFVSNARFGSSTAIKSASGDLSARAAKSGPTSTPSFPRRWHEAQSFLNTTALFDRSPTIASAGRNESTTALRNCAWCAKTASARARSESEPRRVSSRCRRAGSISPGGTHVSSSAESRDDIHAGRLSKVSRITSRTCGECAFQSRTIISPILGSVAFPNATTAAR